MEMISIVVNGDQRRTEPATVDAFLVAHGFNPQRVAVERNGELLTRNHWSNIRLENGDRLEVISFVGGG